MTWRGKAAPAHWSGGSDQRGHVVASCVQVRAARVVRKGRGIVTPGMGSGAVGQDDARGAGRGGSRGRQIQWRRVRRREGMDGRVRAGEEERRRLTMPLGRLGQQLGHAVC